MSVDKIVVDFRAQRGGAAAPHRPTGSSTEDLMGGEGRSVFFRPRRYGPKELGAIHPRVVFVADDGVTHTCRLVDVSQNGVAFEWPADVPVERGASIRQLTVRFDAHDAYSGAARVGSVRDDADARVVGASFADSLMNIEDVLQLRDVRTWDDTSSGGVHASERPWYVAGHAAFKAAVSELRLFLEDAREVLGRLESALPWHVLHGASDSAARSALIDRMMTEFVPDYVQLTERIDTALRAADDDEWLRLKEFSVRHVDDLLLAAPFMQRAKSKPLGYPGDYEVMRFLYERQFEGSTLFAKAVHLGTVWTRGAQAVRCRKDLLKQRLAPLYQQADEDGPPLRIASVAAGPAQETYEFLCENAPRKRRLELVIFDQDLEALQIAHGRLGPLAEGRWKGVVHITFLHDSIRRLLRDPAIFSGTGPFDLIFCAGLFDYLRVPTAVQLTRNLHENLVHGGEVYIGNMVPENPCRWFLEHHLDWNLTYRTPQEMLAFASEAVPSAAIEIVHDSTGINPFLRIRRE